MDSKVHSTISDGIRARTSKPIYGENGGRVQVRKPVWDGDLLEIFGFLEVWRMGSVTLGDPLPDRWVSIERGVCTFSPSEADSEKRAKPGRLRILILMDRNGIWFSLAAHVPGKRAP